MGGFPLIFMEAAEGRLHYDGWCICLCKCMCFILICVGMFHIFLNIFDVFIYMFDMLIDISICLLICIYIYIYRDGPRGVIWNLVVRARYYKVFFTINVKSHEFSTIRSASILICSCGSNEMGRYMLFSCEKSRYGGQVFFSGVFFMEIK